MEQDSRKTYTYDVAVSFAGEDRQIAESIASSLTQRGISVFYDDYEKAELWGKDLYEYLAEVYSSHARYCVMIISVHYAQKLWTNHERRSAQTRAFKEQEEYILPVRLDDSAIPGIHDTVGYIDLRTTPIERLVELLQKKLGRTSESVRQKTKASVTVIPMPRVMKRFTDIERDRFLKGAFSFIKDYFRRGLKQLEAHQPEVKTDFTAVHEFKFLAKIYIHGNSKSRCKIWMGGLTASNSILYSEGTMEIDGDNSYNDYLSIEDDGATLYLKLSNMGYGGNTSDRADFKAAAEYLWKRFVSHLEY